MMDDFNLPPSEKGWPIGDFKRRPGAWRRCFDCVAEWALLAGVASAVGWLVFHGLKVW